MKADLYGVELRGSSRGGSRWGRCLDGEFHTDVRAKPIERIKAIDQRFHDARYLVLEYSILVFSQRCTREVRHRCKPSSSSDEFPPASALTVQERYVPSTENMHSCRFERHFSSSSVIDGENSQSSKREPRSLDLRGGL